MPTAKEFLKGFGFKEGEEFGGYTLEEATCTHEAIKRYQEYKYDIDLVFQNNGHGKRSELISVVNDHISKERIIYGVRNPYKCTISKPGRVSREIHSKITFKFVGFAHRTHVR